jgi:hypothetical protein
VKPATAPQAPPFAKLGPGGPPSERAGPTPVQLCSVKRTAISPIVSRTASASSNPKVSVPIAMPRKAPGSNRMRLRQSAVRR